MYYICNECGEIFETPVYRKNRVGIKELYCPACGSSDDIDEYDDEYDDIVEYEWIDEEGA